MTGPDTPDPDEPLPTDAVVPDSPAELFGADGELAPVDVPEPSPIGPAPSDGIRILGIETSCDETAAAVVVDAHHVLSSVVSSQVDLHARFGGVVPEIASRAHVELLTPVIAQALDRGGPRRRPRRRRRRHRRARPHRRAARRRQRGQGAGARVGRARSSPSTTSRPTCTPRSSRSPTSSCPLVVLLVSGGHTMLVLMEGHGRYRLLGSTIDDAAGEAFDKVARYLGLGYPGGPAIDRVAMEGDPDAIAFPRAIMDDGFDFSFSGLKTSVVNHVRKHPEVATPDVAAIVPGGRGRRARHQGPPGRAASTAPRACAWPAAWPPTRSCASGSLDACMADGLHPFLPEPLHVHRQRGDGRGGGLVAPATATAPSPLDTGATPNLKLPVLAGPATDGVPDPARRRPRDARPSCQHCEPGCRRHRVVPIVSTRLVRVLTTPTEGTAP